MTPSTAITTLTKAQEAAGAAPYDRAIFLEGPAGTGKTTAGVQRLLNLVQSGVAASSILVMTPVRPLAKPYSEALRRTRLRPGSIPALVTAGGLARRNVELFWPLVSRQAGFARPDSPPVFLTLETAQYHMARIARPLLENGYFESVTIDRNRIYSQIIDNLNKAAVVGFPYTEIGQRLHEAWLGDESQLRVYNDAQECATRFREYCLRHNLLDFSLQVEVFRQHLWSLPECRDYLTRSYRHLIVDNLEEDTPFAHDLLRDWLPQVNSALLIYDQEAGYREFLGADPDSGAALKVLCAEHLTLNQSFVASPELNALGARLANALRQPRAAQPPVAPEAVRQTLLFREDMRFYPEMLDWVAGQIADLVDGGVTPSEIVVLAPFLSDSLRFSLTQRLAQAGIAARSHRPSRALRDEPAARSLLTLTALANPDWQRTPEQFDVSYALMQAIDGLDPVRAQLLTKIVYRSKANAPGLSSFEQINPDMHERISYVLGGRYDTLRVWLADLQRRRSPATLDHFLSRLFGEVLSQAGFGFHDNFDASQAAANLVESVQKFRQAVAEVDEQQQDDEGGSVDPGREYLDMVEDGVIAAQYVRGWQEVDRNAVLLAPAHTFLMMNRPVDYQFWLDIGSRGWYERLYQPLTHPYVLSRHWQPGRQWDHDDEDAANQERLYRLAVGLLRRCRKQVFLGLSELGEQGYEQRGPLLWAFNHVLRELALSAELQTQPVASQNTPL
ncbi:MAG: ATP-dependent helicase [Anaerolineae bacterium]|nr:ATP-dependent helicase [Anaerolineae bacterium]